jgi:hypothetical protein
MTESDECLHGMNPHWCAICLKLDEPEEDEVVVNIRSWQRD